MHMPYFLKVILAFGVLFAIVPLVGLMVFGNVRQAWRYTRDWFRVIGWMVAAAVVLFLLFWGIVTPPQ
jgi:hypothetical protein